MKNSCCYKHPGLLVLLLIIGLSVNAQQSYSEKAKIKLVNGEALDGWVERVSASALSKGIRFREDRLTKDYHFFAPDTVAWVRFHNDSVYYDRVNYTYKSEGKQQEENRLARRIIKGYTDLYKLQLPENEYDIIIDDDNTYVYILRKDNQDYVLRQVEYRDGKSYYMDKQYIGRLKYLFADAAELSSELDRLGFDVKSMSDMVYRYNEMVRPSEMNKTYYLKSKLVWLHGPKAAYAHIANSDDGVVTSPLGVGSESIEQVSGNGFSVGYMLSAFYPEISAKLSTNIGFSYTMYFHDASPDRLDDYLFRFPVYAEYKFSRSNVAPFASMGFTVTVSDYYPFHPFVRAGMGVYLFDHFKIHVSYESEQLSLNADQFLFFNVGYVFNGDQY